MTKVDRESVLDERVSITINGFSLSKWMSRESHLRAMSESMGWFLHKKMEIRWKIKWKSEWVNR